MYYKVSVSRTTLWEAVCSLQLCGKGGEFPHVSQKYPSFRTQYVEAAKGAA